MASVSLHDVSKAYGAVDVIHGISLHIDDGEFVALVGPSGCGKSTLLRMIAGLEEITDGEIAIGGNVVNGMTPRERNIAMVFQSYALYPHMTVAENMGFNLKLAGVQKPEIEARVAEAARMLDLAKLLDRKPAQLSGGQPSVSPWAGPSCATLPSSCSTNRFPTSMLNSACRCVRRSRRCTRR